LILGNRLGVDRYDRATRCESAQDYFLNACSHFLFGCGGVVVVGQQAQSRSCAVATGLAGVPLRVRIIASESLLISFLRSPAIAMKMPVAMPTERFSPGDTPEIVPGNSRARLWHFGKFGVRSR